MINLTLGGVLGKHFGHSWKLEVRSIFEAFQAIEANTDKSVAILNQAEKLASHFFVLVNKKIMPNYLFNSEILEDGDEVKIIPVVQGSGFIAALVIGLALTALSMYLAKALSPKAPKDVKTNSRILSKIRNVMTQNSAVPLGYGRLMVGSTVISNDIIVKPYNATNQDYNSESSNAANKLRDISLADLTYSFNEESIVKYYGYNPFIMN